MCVCVCIVCVCVCVGYYKSRNFTAILVIYFRLEKEWSGNLFSICTQQKWWQTKWRQLVMIEVVQRYNDMRMLIRARAHWFTFKTSAAGICSTNVLCGFTLHYITLFITTKLKFAWFTSSRDCMYTEDEHVLLEMHL